MADLFDKLSEEQKQAAFVEKGPIRVVASAGSGKTTTLTARYIWLRQRKSVPARRIACVTFTNKAADEMKQRIRAALGTTEGLDYVCTFHSLGYKILKAEAHRMGWPGGTITIWHEKKTEEILSRIYEESGITGRQVTHKEAKDFIRDRKSEDFSYVSLLYWNAENTLNEFINRAESPREKIYYMYLQKQRHYFCLDFNDMIIIPMYLMDKYTEVSEKWTGRFHYMMVDEFQDVSDLNYMLCEKLAPDNLYIVGDPDQLIYSWRGAKLKYIMEFVDQHPGAQEFEIKINRRSTPAIITAANNLIEHNENRLHKEMIPSEENSGKEDKVRFIHARTKGDEAAFVADEIRRLKESGYEYKDIKILFRSHESARPFEEKFIETGLPYRTVGQTPFYQTKEIEDIMAYLRLISKGGDYDFESAITSPKRNIGKKAFEKIRTRIDEDHPTMLDALRVCIEDESYAPDKAREFVRLIDSFSSRKDEIPLQVLVEEVIEQSGLQVEYQTIGNQEHLDNIAELKNSIRHMEENSAERISLEDYLDEVATFTAIDTKVADYDAVELMTVHAAKGTEAKVVFVVAMNDGTFPSAKATGKKAMEEERRLAYVAYTRAMELLYISESEYYADKPEENPNAKPLLPSPFIFEAGYEEMDHINGEIPSYIMDLMKEKDNPEESSAEEKYYEGDSVHHDTFGDGVVEEAYSDGTLLVNFYDIGEIREIEVDGNLHRI